MLAFSFTGTSDFVEDGDNDAKVKEHHDGIAGSKAGSSVTLIGPNQPQNFNFLKKNYGKQSRSFQSS